MITVAQSVSAVCLVSLLMTMVAGSSLDHGTFFHPDPKSAWSSTLWLKYTICYAIDTIEEVHGSKLTTQLKTERWHNSLKTANLRMIL